MDLEFMFVDLGGWRCLVVVRVGEILPAKEEDDTCKSCASHGAKKFRR